jgi:hypothetical protein
LNDGLLDIGGEISYISYHYGAFMRKLRASDRDTLDQINNWLGWMRESGMKPFRDRARTLIRHHYSNYDALIRDLPTLACENRFKYLVQKTIMAFANEKYRV